MNLKQQQYDNGSTSTSQYFQKRHLNTNDHQTYQFTKKVEDYFIPQSQQNHYTSQVNSIFKELTNQNNDYLQSCTSSSQWYRKPKIMSQLTQISRQKKHNPFLSTKYSDMFGYCQDNVYQSNQGSPNEAIIQQDPKNIKIGQNLKQSRYEVYRYQPEIHEHHYNYKQDSQSKTHNYQLPKTHHYQQALTINSPNNKESTSNLSVKNMSAQFTPTIVTFQKTSEHQVHQYSQNNQTSLLNHSKASNYHQDENFMQQQPKEQYKNHQKSLPDCNSTNHIQQLLGHIHFTIQHEKQITKSFKIFADNEKKMIRSRFQHMLREIANTLDQVRLGFEKQLDHNYQLMLHELKEIKNIAVYLWRDSSEIKNKQDQFLNNQRITLKKSRLIHNTLSDSQFRAKSLSKPLYPGLSTGVDPSPRSNQYLLTQLQKEDHRLQVYKQTKQFYFSPGHLKKSKQEKKHKNQSKQQILSKMSQLTRSISAKIAQCQDYFVKIVNEKCKQLKRITIDQNIIPQWIRWTQKPSKNKICSKYSINDSRFVGSDKDKEIHILILEELQKLASQCVSFRKSLRSTYVLSQKDISQSRQNTYQYHY